jgi:hypothetical protein
MCLTSDFVIVCNAAITWSATVIRKSFELVSYVVRILIKLIVWTVLFRLYTFSKCMPSGDDAGY